MEIIRDILFWRPSRITLQSAILVSAVYQLGFLSAVALVVCLRHDFDGRAILRIIEAWDAHHYLFVAEHGYLPEGEGRLYIVFLPLYPLCIRALNWILDSPHVSAVIVSNVCSILGHALFLLMLRGLGLPSKRCWRALMLLFVTPPAIYFFNIYTEGLYLLLLTSFFCLLYAKRFPLAAAAGFLASMTKVFGVYLAIAYYVYLLERPRERLGIGSLACGLAIPLGFLVYLYINYAVFGDPLRFLQFQKENWHEELSNPIAKYISAFQNNIRGRFSEFFGVALGEAASLAALPLMLAYLLLARRPFLPLHLWAWTLVSWGLICSQSYWLSNIRYLGVILPFYVMVEHVASKAPFGFRITMAVSTILCGVMLYLVVRGYWAA